VWQSYFVEDAPRLATGSPEQRGEIVRRGTISQRPAPHLDGDQEPIRRTCGSDGRIRPISGTSTADDRRTIGLWVRSRIKMAPDATLSIEGRTGRGRRLPRLQVERHLHDDPRRRRRRMPTRARQSGDGGLERWNSGFALRFPPWYWSGVPLASPDLVSAFTCY
jgi:hypothetical protein